MKSISQSQSDRICTLVIPGLLGLASPDCKEIYDHVGTLVELEKFLGRAQSQSTGCDGLENTLLNLFELERAPERDLPVAPLSYLHDAEASSPPLSSYLLRADPVYLTADRDHLVLTAPELLDLSQTEADQIVAELNTFFEEDGWRFEALTPIRWYLHLTDDPQIRTYDLATVRGRAIDDFLPTGVKGKQWHRIINEIQMILHSCEVNQNRLATNQLPVSSLWFWGGGYLPEAGECEFSQLWSTEAVSSGLAQLSHTPQSGLPDSAIDWLAQADSSGEHLIVLDYLQQEWQSQGMDVWAISVRQLNQQWFAPLLEALKSKKIKQINLYDCRGRVFRLTRAGLKRWWRRKSMLEKFCYP